MLLLNVKLNAIHRCWSVDPVMLCPYDLGVFDDRWLESQRAVAILCGERLYRGQIGAAVRETSSKMPARLISI